MSKVKAKLVRQVVAGELEMYCNKGEYNLLISSDDGPSDTVIYHFEVDGKEVEVTVVGEGNWAYHYIASMFYLNREYGVSLKFLKYLRKYLKKRKSDLIVNGERFGDFL